jgi:flagellar biosynthesis/type III secretory pathway protein FliH
MAEKADQSKTGYSLGYEQGYAQGWSDGDTHHERVRNLLQRKLRDWAAEREVARRAMEALVAADLALEPNDARMQAELAAQRAEDEAFLKRFGGM